jgi:hypothetical protein
MLHSGNMTKFKSCSGLIAQDLEEAFLRFGVDVHKESIALFERHVAEGKDPQLRGYAEQTLPGLRDHVLAAHKLLYAAAATR